MDGKLFGAKADYPAWPWPYTQVDPETARYNGHDAFWSGKGCSYGAFHGVVQTLRDAVGEPFTSFPDEIMLYGYGGGVGWGATCGAINGAAAAISLVSTKEVVITSYSIHYTKLYENVRRAAVAFGAAGRTDQRLRAE